MKIIVGSVMTDKLGYIEDKTMEGRSRSMKKEVVMCVQDMVGKKKIEIKFEDGQSKNTGSGLLLLILSKEEVGNGEEDSTSTPPSPKVKVNVYY